MSNKIKKMCSMFSNFFVKRRRESRHKTKVTSIVKKIIAGSPHMTSSKDLEELGIDQYGQSLKELLSIIDQSMVEID